MRVADFILRQGHLSESALLEAITLGERPRHLDQCERCGARAVDLARWLDDIKVTAEDAVGHDFPAERLAAQHGQIMRRLEQADEPTRVIEFPRTATVAARGLEERRIAPAWLAVAAAAGVLVGVVGTQWSVRHDQQAASEPAPRVPSVSQPAPSPVPASPAAVTASSAGETPLLELDLDGLTPETLRVFDEATPRLVSSRYTSVR